MSIQWNADYTIGVTIIDEQHKLLFQLINDLDSIRSSDLPPKSELQNQLLDRLDYYIKVHFITEEEIMRIYNYPNFDIHKQMHAKFSDKIATFRSQYHNEGPIFFDSVYTFLESWLKSHIAIEDHNLGHYLNAKGLN
jgi:hemerythrin-like metal-binding protein